MSFAVVHTPQDWATKPLPEGARVRLGHPLARNLAFTVALHGRPPIVNGIASAGAGTLQGGAGALRLTARGPALDFDGTNDRVDFAANAALPNDIGAGAWSFVIWAVISTTATNQYLLVEQDAANTANAALVNVPATTQFGMFAAVKATAGLSRSVNTGVLTASGSLRHLAGTWDGVDNPLNILLYLDGRAPALTSGTATVGARTTGGGIWSLGGREVVSPTRYFTGGLFAVSVWQRTLTADEVAWTYASPWDIYEMPPVRTFFLPFTAPAGGTGGGIVGSDTIPAGGPVIT